MTYPSAAVDGSQTGDAARSEPAAPQTSRPWWHHALAVVVSIVFLLPLLVMVSGSLRRPGSPPPRSPELVPTDPSLTSYREAFELVDLGIQLRNSLLVSVVATAIAVASASLAGFVIARGTRRVAVVLIGLAVVGIVVPPTALLVGRFTLYRSIGMLDTYAPLVAPALYGVNSLGVLMFAWAFSRIPPSLFEMAEIEGVSPVTAWRRIAMPLSRPMTVAVATLAFVTTWNDFLSPLVFLTSQELFTVPLGLRSLQLVGGQDVPVLLAACVVATVPVMVVFLLGRRRLFDSVGEAR